MKLENEIELQKKNCATTQKFTVNVLTDTLLMFFLCVCMYINRKLAHTIYSLINCLFSLI